MSDDTRKPPRPSHPTSIPPEVPAELDSSWDDDTMPRLELDDPMSESAFDRVTAIPELPPALYAKLSEQTKETVAPAAPAPEPASDEERPSQNLATARPGRLRAPFDVEPTGLELADVGPPPATARSTSSELRRDPRDPILELDLSEVARSGPPPAVLIQSPASSNRNVEIGQMKDRYATGDFTGALVVAEGLLEVNADDLDAQRYAQSCRDVLTQMYSARLGSLAQRVRVAVPGDQIRWLSLDHRAGFVLSLIDGSSTVEELLDISGMNRLDALRILYTLYDQRVIALG
jgi:hypothetical protein